MKLENQVCSLDLAQRLKTLGVKQESAFAWWANSVNSVWKLWGTGSSIEEWVGDLRIAAFTTAELGEMLPPFHSISWQWTENTDARGAGMLVLTNQETGLRYIEHADTEADARAKMLIYLIDNKLVDPTTL